MSRDTFRPRYIQSYNVMIGDVLRAEIIDPGSDLAIYYQGQVREIVHGTNSTTHYLTKKGYELFHVKLGRPYIGNRAVTRIKLLYRTDNQPLLPGAATW